MYFTSYSLIKSKAYVRNLATFFILNVFVLILLACVKMDGFLGENWAVGLLMFNLYALAG
jgi:hypothetical protein